MRLTKASSTSNGRQSQIWFNLSQILTSSQGGSINLPFKKQTEKNGFWHYRNQSSLWLQAFPSPNLENHSISSTSYDEKMIINLPSYNLPRSSYNLPRSSSNLPRPSYNLPSSDNNLLDRTQTPGPGQDRTKTLQEITFRGWGLPHN